MDNEAPALRLIGDETDAGLCVDGVCAIPQAAPEAQDAQEVAQTAAKEMAQ